MSYPVVLRMKGLFPNQLARFQMHARRSGGDLSNIDHSKSFLNEVVLGSEDWVEKLRAEIAAAAASNLANAIAARRARNRPAEARALERQGLVDPWKFTRIGPLREGVLTVNKAWFGGTGATFWCPKKVAAFRERGIAFLNESFGGICVHARLDHDEEALHFHFVLAPWHEKHSANRGRQKLLQPSSHLLIADYERAQDVVAEFFADLGIARGQRHAAAQRDAKVHGTALPPRPVHVPPAVWRKKQQQELSQAMAALAQESASMQAKRARADALERALKAVSRREIVYVRPAADHAECLKRGPAFPSDKAERQALKAALQSCEPDLMKRLRAFSGTAQAILEQERLRLAATEKALRNAAEMHKAREAIHRQNAAKVTRAATRLARDSQSIAAAVDRHGLDAIPELSDILSRYVSPQLGKATVRPTS